jgi:methyl-accepting chemotaxis protein
MKELETIIEDGGMFPETKTADEVNKVVKSMDSMVSSIEKAKKLGKIDSVITLSKDAVSGYDNLSVKMKELETIIEDGGYSIETLNGKILGTTQNFIATKDQIKAAKQAMQEYVSVFEEYVVVQQQQDMILRSVVSDLGYIGLSTGKQQEIVARFSETIGNIHSTAKSASDGVNSFRSSLLKQQEPINQYATSLNDILNAYAQIDKLEVEFPLVPDSVIARLREMVRLSAEAATGIHSKTV